MTPVERLYQELGEAQQVLAAAGEASLQSTVQDHTRKALLLAVASYFEHRITAGLETLAATAENPHLREFAVNTGVSRKYHTMFDWDAANANAFFGLFGADFKSRMKKKVAADPELGAAVKAFLELGQQRNRLVHQDYATFALEKTSEEIFSLYKTAIPFVESVPTFLSEWQS